MGFHIYDTETKDFNEILTAEALSKKVYDTLSYYQKRCEMLAKANQELMDDALTRADTQLKREIETLKERLSLCVTELASKKELNAYNAFVDEHQRCRSFSKHFQCQIPYVIQYGAGVGMISKVRCPICGEERDITDTEVW